MDVTYSGLANFIFFIFIFIENLTRIRYIGVLLCMVGSPLSRQVDDELEIKAYYAGHVIGAAMFHIQVGQQSVVYTVRSKSYS